jgi:uncharacterized protein YdbL (DUF1318 family)
MSRRSFLTTVLSFATIAVAVVTAPAVPAWAAGLDDLRASGAIAERFDGYVEVRGSGTAEAKSTVKKVNAQRRDIYEKRASEQGVSAEQVGRVYAKQIYQKAPSGTYFKREDGSYIRK